VTVPVGRATPTIPPRRRVAIDRAGCLELAVGSIANVLGERFAAIDGFPTRVRLPDEPLMLVDRIVEIDAEPLSMTHGRVVTEHDVHAQRWYLDGGRIPTAIAVEAGQADLFLSGYLGIDLQTRGKAVYRLLDAAVEFHDALPGPGATIRYDIAIERFFRHGDTWMFRFRFDATVDGRPLLTMRDGCAGFFTETELQQGKGIVRPRAQPLPDDAPPPARVPSALASPDTIVLDETQLDALRAGDLATAFGPAFADLPVHQPLTLPAEPRLRLVHRVTALQLEGGEHGRGFVRAEADIDPQEWFLTCHFVDDQVMPGTLMYECCLHALRILMLRRGIVGEAQTCAWQPIPGVRSRLVCRGQVLPTTERVTYEVTVREIVGTKAIADAAMFADGKRIVDIHDMTLQLTGATVEHVAALAMDKAGLVAFARGNPSDAFGAPYRPFDEQRRIARLPAPPFQFLDRILEVNAPAFTFRPGIEAVAECDARTFAWTLQANRQQDPAFAVVLEAALQPCGWLAAHIGSALRSDTDLRFRNLGGEAVLHRPIDPRDDVLRTRVRVTNLSQSGGMIIEHFAFELSGPLGPIYSGTTYFGFFSAAALAEQVGLRDAEIVTPTAAARARGKAFVLPHTAPLPDDRFRMVDAIDLLDPDGFVEGSIPVDPDAWFFAAHFVQDPVWPGSLGLEAVLQLCKAFALDRWDLGANARFSTLVPGLRHRWTYRGQITPAARRVQVQAMIKEIKEITAIDDAAHRLCADGLVVVDGRPIYRLHDFGLEVRP
jgi:3-hydroxymyristoyl/3-hydroxydecanoyl-(acyl carrier protein) dehydratase